MAVVTNPEFNSCQMDEILVGFHNGLSMDQVKVYANPKFDSFQMNAIREALVMGLTVDQVKALAKLDQSAIDMLAKISTMLL